MSKYYAAVDMGASSGRLMVGWTENGKMQLEEIHRFENGMVKKDDELCWEFDRIFREIVTGLKKCKELGKIPVSLGVDTWGVDFVLLDKDGGEEEISAVYGAGRFPAVCAGLLPLSAVRQKGE